MTDLIEEMIKNINLIESMGQMINVGGQQIMLDKDFITDKLQQIGAAAEEVETVDGVTYVLDNGDFAYLLALGYLTANFLELLKEIKDEVEDDLNDDEPDGSGGGPAFAAPAG